ncbi:uncharacterized protein GIQ15_03630 [Arthroderma uncinatum]|uniref:uncharacterized protein n=1 Tax=Arthroderma uncinatum TaxID=74035 RepID=UPI00144AF3A3|nr:uncharacterized protein GIQ15_03630 [Arthroderma uncinatum]KAF3484306.1 hypothetical protein GIQ15_03630 [Arthroderma uncinatum]
MSTMISSQPHRLFNFEGDDAEYCKFLEQKLLRVQQLYPVTGLSTTLAGQIYPANSEVPAIEPSLASEASHNLANSTANNTSIYPVANSATPTVELSLLSRSSHPTNSPVHTANHNGTREESTLEIIPYKPEPTSSGTIRTRRSRWSIEVDNFLSNIPKDWSALQAITREEVYRLLLNCEIHFHNGKNVPANNSIDVPTGLDPLATHCYKYALNTSIALEQHFAYGSILGLRVIIVGLMCSVMRKRGASVKAVNPILKACLPRSEKIQDRTLMEIRAAARWANILVLQLAKRGWGNRSAEIFFRFGRSIYQNMHMCKNAESREVLMAALDRQKKPVPQLSEDQMQVSFPCILGVLGKDFITLKDICEELSCETPSGEKLSYNYEHTVQTYKRLYTPCSDDETAYPSPPPINLSDDDSGEVESVAEAQSPFTPPSGRSEGDLSDYGPHPEGDSNDSETDPAPPPQTNQGTDTFQVLVEAAEACAKQTNKRPYPADIGSQCRDSQRRRLSEQTEGDNSSTSSIPSPRPGEAGSKSNRNLSQDSSYSAAEVASEPRQQLFPENDARRSPRANNTTLSNAAQQPTGTPFQLDPNFTIDPASLDKSAPYQSPQRRIIRTHTNTATSIEYDPFAGADSRIPPVFQNMVDTSRQEHTENFSMLLGDVDIEEFSMLPGNVDTEGSRQS